MGELGPISLVPGLKERLPFSLGISPRVDDAEREERVAPRVDEAVSFAVLADPEDRMGVLLMARPADCYAISTRYHAEDESDRLTSYSAFDFSLFGGDVLPGDERTVTVRLAVTALDGDYSKALATYRAYVGE